MIILFFSNKMQISFIANYNQLWPRTAFFCQTVSNWFAHRSCARSRNKLIFKMKTDVIGLTSFWLTFIKAKCKQTNYFRMHFSLLYAKIRWKNETFRVKLYIVSFNWFAIDYFGECLIRIIRYILCWLRSRMSEIEFHEQKIK